ncbi:MAG: TRAP transporter large permease [Lachnospiraceae bacterium]|nr:TRAP transporter large permease [Lachnospiraceae bacterium]
MELSVVAMLIFVIVAMLCGTPITWAIGGGCALACALDSSLSFSVLAQKVFTGGNSFSMLAVPAFYLAGDIMCKGGLSKRLVAFADSFVGWISGGISLVSIVACMFFAAISGSSVATTAAIGGLMIPEMEKRGYPKDYAAAVQAIGGTLGIVIPPSIVFVIYGNITGVSVSKLLAAGILPGILVGIALCLYAFFKAKLCNYPKQERFSITGFLLSFKHAIWALIMPIIILGGIYAGIFTPTESAVIAVFYGVLVCMAIYKEVHMLDLWEILGTTAASVSNLMILVVIAQLFGYILTYYRIPVYVTEVFMAVAWNKYVFLLLINVLLLICGMFLEVGATNLILGPILAPIAVSFGIDPIHFGMLFVYLLALGQATPPFGTTMFVACGISGVPISNIAKQLLPFIVVEIFCALLFSFVPILSTWIPSWM